MIATYLIFRTSVVQSKITTYLAEKYSKELGTTIKIGGVDISWFMNIVLEKVEIFDKHNNILLGAKEIEVKYKKYSKKKGILALKSLQVDSLNVALRKYAGEKSFNYVFILEHFASKDTTTGGTPIKLVVEKLILRNSTFAYSNDKYLAKDGIGIDYNHIAFNNINLNSSSLVIDTGWISTKINSLSLSEKSGLNLNSTKTNFILGPNVMRFDSLTLTTDSSSIKTSLAFNFKSWTDWDDFVNKVSLDAIFDTTLLNLGDLTYFSPSLDGMKDEIYITGKASGTIDNLKCRNLELAYGSKTKFSGKVSISGLPYIDKAFIDMKINDFYTNIADIEMLDLPGGKKIEIPNQLNDLGYIGINGRFSGFYNNFVAFAAFRTGAGNLQTDINLSQADKNSKIIYKGVISSDNFNLGKMIDNNKVGLISLAGKIDGAGFDKDLTAKIDLVIAKIDLNGSTYFNSKVVGKIENRNIEAEVESADSLFSIWAKGSYNFGGELPVYNFAANLKNARISKILPEKQNSKALVSCNIKSNFSGNSIDNFIGDVRVDSVVYTHFKKHELGNLFVSSVGNNSGRKIIINSSYLDGVINGNFEYNDLLLVAEHIRSNFIPALTKPFVNPANLNEISASKAIDFSFQIKNSKDISELWVPSLVINKPSTLVGRFNGDGKILNITGEFPSINYNTTLIQNTNLTVNSKEGEFKINSLTRKIIFSNTQYIDSLLINPEITGDHLDFSMKYGRLNDSLNSATLDFYATFLSKGEIKGKIKSLGIWLNKKYWISDSTNIIEYRDKDLLVNNLKIFSGGNSMSVNGRATESENDILIVAFNNFDLEFFNYWLKRYETKLGGSLSGNLDISTLFNTPKFNSDFNISQFAFNGETLGNLAVDARWNANLQAIYAEASILDNSSADIRRLNAKGYFYPKNKQNSLNFDVDVNKMPVTAVGPYLTSFTTDIEGDASGRLKILGTPREIEIWGELAVDARRMRVDYLNTYYSLNEKLKFTKDYFAFENAKVYDSYYNIGNQGHTGILNMKISHKFFHDWGIDIDVKANKIHIMNTTAKQNELFYGEAFGDATIKIKGTPSLLDFDIFVKSGKDTKVSIPYSDNTEVETGEFINFISKNQDDITVKKIEDVIESNFAITMNLEMDITPDASVKLIMDETMGDVITSRGEGNLRITMDREENVEMYGLYKVTKGDYLFTMGNLGINKYFTLKPGGTITWDGDMMGAKMNMQAFYSTEAVLSDLISQIDTTNKRSTKVNCIIDISGILSLPTVKFDIELPDESAEVKELVKSVLYSSGDNVNQDMMNKNFVSLLVLGKFQQPAGFYDNINQNALAANATELLTHQVSNMLNKLSDDIDIGFSYDPGDEVTTQEMAVALSYEMFNERLLIDTKMGAGGESKSDEASTRIMANINLEYKITEDGQLRAKVFNRTNYYDPLTTKSQYTQGAALSFQKEFNTVRELFGIKSKKPKLPESNQEPQK